MKFYNVASLVFIIFLSSFHFSCKKEVIWNLNCDQNEIIRALKIDGITEISSPHNFKKNDLAHGFTDLQYIISNTGLVDLSAIQGGMNIAKFYPENKVYNNFLKFLDSYKAFIPIANGSKKILDLILET